MIIMSEEQVSAEEALARIEQMPQAEYDKLMEMSQAELYEPQVQAYLEREGIHEGLPLHPQENEAEVLSYLDEMDWDNFLIGESA